MRKLLFILFLVGSVLQAQTPLTTTRLTTDTIRFRLITQLPTHPPTGIKQTYWLNNLWLTDSTAHYRLLTTRDSGDYVKRNGTTPLTGDWAAGAFKISNTDIIQGNVLISNNGINGYLTEFNASKAIDTAFIYHSGNEYRINSTTDNGAFQLQVAGGGYFGGTTRISSATSPRLDFLRAATKQWQMGIPTSTTRFSFFEDGTDERFVIKAGGNVGIKVTDPVTTLDVNGSIRSRSGVFQLNDGTTTGGGLYFYKTITGSGSSLAPTLFAETGNALYFMVNGSPTPKAMLTSGGKFNINDVSNTTYDLYVNGTAKVVTSVTTPTIKLTTGASVNYIWKCTNADGSGAWVAMAASETYKGVVDGDDGKINHGATALIDGTGTSGDYYRCYDAGTYDYGNPSGNSITLEIGDEVHYDGAKWQYQEGVGYTLQAMDATTLGGAKLGGSLQINSEVLNINNADMTDITVSGTGSDVGKIWTIDNDAVTYAKMQNISAQWKILGRSSSGAGDTEELSMSGTGKVVGDISPVITDSIRVPAVAFGSAWVNSTAALDRGSAYPKFKAAQDSITKHTGWYYSLRDSVRGVLQDSVNFIHWSDTIAKIATKYDIDTLSASSLGGATKALDNLASVAINASLLPGTSDAVSLGSTSKMWSDLHLASGGVISWDSGDVTLTHSSKRLSLNGILLTDSLIHGKDGISVFSSEAGKTEHRITMDASNADDMRIYAYDLTSSEYKPLTIGGDTTTIINDSLKVNGGANFGDSVLFAKPLIISSPSSGVSEAIKFKNTLGNSHSGISAYSQDESNSILLIGSNLYISGGSLARYDLTEAGSYIVMEGGDMYWGTVTSAGVNNSSMLISETGDLTVYKKATFQTVDHASTDLDKFAAFTAGGELQYRTGVELLSDIGGQASITPQNVTAGSNKITLGGTPTGASLQAFSIDVDQSKIDHNSLLNYIAAKHFYQSAIDTVHTTLTGLLKATSGVLSAASAGTDYQAPLTNPVTGTGTANTLTKFTGTSTTGNASITDNGSLVTFTTPLLATSFQSSTNDVVFGNTSTTSEYMRFYYNGGTGYVSLRSNGTEVLKTTDNGVNAISGKPYLYNGGKFAVVADTATTVKATWEADDIRPATRKAIAGYVAANGGGVPGGSGSEVQYRSSATAFGGFSGINYSSGNMLFSDNIQALFGTGSDLKIYHDGTSNQIQTVGVDMLFGNGSSSGEYMRFYNDGGTGYVSLRQNSNEVLRTTSTGVNVPSSCNYYLNGSKYNLDETTAGTTKATWDADDTYGVTRAAIAGYVAANGGTTPGGSTTEIQYNNAGAFGGVSGVKTDGTSLICGDNNVLYFGTDKDFGVHYSYSTIPSIAMGGSGIEYFGLSITDPVIVADYSGAAGADHYLQLGELGEAYINLNLTDGTCQTLNLSVSGYSTASTYLQAGSYVNAVTGFKYNGTSGVTVTKTVGSDQVVVQGGIITSWQAAPAPPPVPRVQNPDESWGMNTTEYTTEYNEDYTQIRKVTKVYVGGNLEDKKVGEWKDLTKAQKKLIKDL